MFHGVRLVVFDVSPQENVETSDLRALVPQSSTGRLPTLPLRRGPGRETEHPSAEVQVCRKGDIHPDTGLKGKHISVCLIPG